MNRWVVPSPVSLRDKPVNKFIVNIKLMRILLQIRGRYSIENPRENKFSKSNADDAPPKSQKITLLKKNHALFLNAN